MKTSAIRKITLSVFAGFLCLMPVHAEVMRHFHSDISMDQSGSVEVKESFAMDFQGEERHGIVRHIPVRLERRHVPYSVYFKLLSVTDADNQPLPFTQSCDGAQVELKIGEPGKTIAGRQTYQIKYEVKRVINWVRDLPEFYWNATGDQWRFVIEEADVTLQLPPRIPPGPISILSFQGPPGSNAPAVSKLVGDKVYYSCHNLQPGQGLTIAVSLPIGTLNPPDALKELSWWLADWWQAVTIPLIAFISLFILWLTGGRDKGSGKAVAVEWNPPKGLSPAEMGTLVDEQCDLKDITSTLIDLAARGYLKIKELKTENFFFMTNKDYEFEKTAPPVGAEPLSKAEQLFLDAIFPSEAALTTTRLSERKGKFYPYLQAIRDAIYESLTTKQLFRHNPETIRRSYFAVALVMFLLAVWALGCSIPTSLGIGVASIIVALFAPAMPARTAKGSQLTRESLGFARFVNKAEKERIKILAAEDPTIFGRLLPYAMVLGAADQWAQVFKELAIEPPSWYAPTDGCNDYSTAVFVNNLGSAMRSFDQTFATPAGSNTSSAWDGGSAFDGGGSGGGFGGGGGSSW